MMEEDIKSMPLHIHIHMHTQKHSCVPTYILTCMRGCHTHRHEERKALDFPADIELKTSLQAVFQSVRRCYEGC